MSCCVRLFATIPFSTLVPVQAHMLKRGFEVLPVGTNQLDILYSRQQPPLTVDLTDYNSSTTRQTIVSFIEQVVRLPQDVNQQLVLGVLARTLALVTIGANEYNEMVDTVLESIANYAEGLFQVDGNGFYDGQTLILRLD